MAREFVFRRIRGKIVRIAKDKSKDVIGKQVNRINQAFKKQSRIDKKIQKHFGYTGDIREAGYIDRKGRLIDLSGTKQGSTDFGKRYLDHREIDNVFRDPKAPDRTTNMFRFMRSQGAIRVSDNRSLFAVDLTHKPNAKQLAKLKAYSKGKFVYADLTNSKTGYTKATAEETSITKAVEKLFKRKKK